MWLSCADCAHCTCVQSLSAVGPRPCALAYVALSHASTHFSLCSAPSALISLTAAACHVLCRCKDRSPHSALLVLDSALRRYVASAYHTARERMVECNTPACILRSRGLPRARATHAENVTADAACARARHRLDCYGGRHPLHGQYRAGLTRSDLVPSRCARLRRSNMRPRSRRGCMTPCIEASRSDHAVAVVHGAIEQSDAGRACTVSWARVAAGAAISWALGGHGCITIERLCMQLSAGLWRGAADRLGDHQDGGPARCGAVAAPQVCWPGLSWPWMAAAQPDGTIGERAGR